MADKIAAMADRFRTEIDTGNKETEAKRPMVRVTRYLNMPFSMPRWLLPTQPHKREETAVRKRAALLRVDKGEVFFNRGERRVKVVISRDEQRRVLMMAVL